MSTLGQYDKMSYDFINPEFFVKKKEKIFENVQVFPFKLRCKGLNLWPVDDSDYKKSSTVKFLIKIKWTGENKVQKCPIMHKTD